MDLACFRELLTPAGQAALAAAAELAPTEARFLASFEKLRKAHPAELAKAALETVLLRLRARDKFAQADRMYFTREALEQSSGELVARHRARRFAPLGTVADLGCGIGADALALAACGLMVYAIERDPLRAAMAQANAEALGLADRIRVREADALTVELPDVRGAFADPARRADRRRHLDPEEYTPPLSAIRDRFPPGFPLGVKIAPGVAQSDIAELPAEGEFISVGGELKECVLWFGSLRTARRRATILPSGFTRFADESLPLPPVESVGEYIYDPDPAIVRAGLAGLVATDLHIAPIDSIVALFTGQNLIASPAVTGYRVELAERVNVPRLRTYLRERGVGRITPIKRGSSIDTDELVKKLKLVGEGHRVVVLTRLRGEQTMIVGERLAADERGSNQK